MSTQTASLGRARRPRMSQGGQVDDAESAWRKRLAERERWILVAMAIVHWTQRDRAAKGLFLSVEWSEPQTDRPPLAPGEVAPPSARAVFS